MLCIDDEPNALAGWCLYLQSAGYDVRSASSAQEGLELFATQPVDAVVLGYSMPEMDGAEVAATMKQIKPEVVILMFSGRSALRLLSSVDAWLTKEVHPEVLLWKLEGLLEDSEGDNAATG